MEPIVFDMCRRNGFDLVKLKNFMLPSINEFVTKQKIQGKQKK